MIQLAVKEVPKESMFTGTQVAEEVSQNLLTCFRCEEDLLNVMVVDRSPIYGEYQASCHRCGGVTPRLELAGKTMIAGVGNNIWVGYDDNGRLKTGKKS